MSAAMLWAFSGLFLIMGIRSASLFFLIISFILGAVGYERFRKNYIQKKKILRRETRRSEAIDVDTEELKE